MLLKNPCIAYLKTDKIKKFDKILIHRGKLKKLLEAEITQKSVAKTISVYIHTHIQTHTYLHTYIS